MTLAWKVLRPAGLPVALAVALLAAPSVQRAPAAPGPPDLPLAAYVVVDGLDGHVIASENADQRRSIASLTKMMTAHLTLDAGHLGKVVTVPAAATTIGESVVGLRAGEQVTRRHLLEGLMVWSGNDTAEALALDLAGSQSAFAARMNAEARRLRLRNTGYVTPYGLDTQGQYSSARDQATLARILMRSPELRRIVNLRSVSFEGHSLPTRNTLLGTYVGVDGVKTGHTSQAGWCLAASAVRGGRRLFVVGLGAPDETTRDVAMRTLLDWGFARFHRDLLARARTPVATLPTAYGTPIPVVLGRDVRALLRDDERVKVRLVLPQRAPIGTRGTVVGKAVYLVGRRQVGSAPLRLGADNDPPSFLDQLKWVGGRTVDRLLDPGSWF